MRLCRKLSFEDVLRCSLGLTKSQAGAMKRIMRFRKPFTVEQLAEGLGKDRSVAQRHLSALGRKGVVFRLQRNRDEGGYEFVYRTLERKELKRILMRGLGEFTSQVESMINDI